MPILFSGWDTPLNLLKAEVTQLEYEGRPVPGRLKERINNLPVTNDPWPTPEMEILAEELERGGILLRAGSWKGLAEEAPLAYKDVDKVVEACHGAGLARQVARLRPLAVIKG